MTDVRRAIWRIRHHRKSALQRDWESGDPVRIARVREVAAAIRAEMAAEDCARRGMTAEVRGEESAEALVLEVQEAEIRGETSQGEAGRQEREAEGAIQRPHTQEGGRD